MRLAPIRFLIVTSFATVCFAQGTPAPTPKPKTPSSGTQPKASAPAGSAASLKYFVGSWVYAPPRDPAPNSGCTFHSTSKMRLVVETTDDPNKLSVKDTATYAYAVTSGGCTFPENGKSFYARTQQYSGRIYKEGSEFRFSIADGKCTGDCAQADLIGATYTLEADSQNKMVRISKIDNERVAFSRE
jgi:hypothetical protein